VVKKIANLQNKAKDEVMVSVEFDRPIGIELLQRIQGVKKVQKTETNTFTVTSGAQIDLRKVLFDFAVANNLTVLSLNKKENSLEQVFRSLTSNNQR
jgi:ABC-2 type transport system ATP-binding protein